MQWERSPNMEEYLGQAAHPSKWNAHPSNGSVPQTPRETSARPHILLNTLAAAVTSSESAPFCHFLGALGLTGTEG